MDSGNSASLQSSSGGDDNQEYNSSRASDHQTNSSFSSQLFPQNTSMFDPFANYFNPINLTRPQQQQQQHLQLHPNYNLDMENWSKTLRSDHNSLPFGQSQQGVSFPSTVAAAAEHSSAGITAAVATAPAAAVGVGETAPPQDKQQQPARNPKKRSRASRRAPTTVLTTDTSNFRAMVQEFTGIPSPPFTATSYFPRSTRLDNIFSNSNLRSVQNNSTSNTFPLNISQPPNYLRRPFPQKVNQPLTPFLSPNNSSSSSSSSSLLSCLASNSAMSSELGLLKPQQFPSGVSNAVTQNSNLFTSNIQQNSVLASLLQSSHHEKYQLGSKDQEPFQIPSSNNTQVKMGGSSNNILEEYGMSSGHHHQLSGLPNLISPEQESSRNINHGDSNKAQETVGGSRGEGMVESWICSSD